MDCGGDDANVNYVACGPDFLSFGNFAPGWIRIAGSPLPTDASWKFIISWKGEARGWRLEWGVSWKKGLGVRGGSEVAPSLMLLDILMECSHRDGLNQVWGMLEQNFQTSLTFSDFQILIT